MIQTLLVWLVILVFTLGAGLIIQALGVYKHNDSILFIFVSGFCFLIVYAQTYSLLFPIKSCIALLFLLLLYVFIVLMNRKKISRYLEYVGIKRFLKKIFINKIIYLYIVFCLVFISFILIMSIQTSFEVDDYLYHCQAVRWIEEIGTVKGSGLINSRISFNSSLFAIYALFGFRDIFGETLHAVVGFVAIISIICLLIEVYKKKNIYSFCTFVVVIYYIICVRTSLCSLNTDLIPNILIGCIFDLWLNNDSTYSRADLCMFVFVVITMKLSFAVLALLVVLPIVELVKNKKSIHILYYIICGLTLTLPFLIRNYFISGWLLYPSTAINIFNVEWKVPKLWAQDQADWVYAWARRGDADGSEVAHAPIKYWLPLWWKWFATRNIKIILLASLLLIVFWIFIVLFKLIKNKYIKSSVLSLLATLSLENIYWLVTAPDIRFSFVSIYSLPILMIAIIPFVQKTFNKIFDNKLIQLSLITLVICYFGLRFRISDCKYPIFKADGFVEMETKEYILTNKIVLYYPTGEYGWAVGADYFPGGDYIENIMQIEPIGETIKEGFRIKK